MRLTLRKTSWEEGLEPLDKPGVTAVRGSSCLGSGRDL